MFVQGDEGFPPTRLQGSVPVMQLQWPGARNITAFTISRVILRYMHIHVMSEKNYASSANRARSGRAARRPDQDPSGRRDRIRSWARCQAGRAWRSLAAPAPVRRTSFSRRSFPVPMATQPESIRGRRLRVSVVSSSDVRPLRSRCRTSPARLRWQNSEYWVVRRPTLRSSSS